MNRTTMIFDAGEHEPLLDDTWDDDDAFLTGIRRLNPEDRYATDRGA